jgi:O-antigen/teichoic acid export membrane protein
LSYFKNNTAHYIALNIVDFIIHPLFILLVIPIIVVEYGDAGLGYWMFLIALYSLGGVLNLGISNATLQFLTPRDITDKSSAYRRVWYLFVRLESFLFVLLFLIFIQVPDLYGSRSFSIEVPVLLIILLFLVLEQIDLQIAAFLKIADYIKLNSVLDISFRILGVILSIALLLRTKEMESFFVVVTSLQILKVGAKWTFLQSLKIVDSSHATTKVSSKNFKTSFFFVASGFVLLALNGYFLMMAERLLLPAFLGFELSGRIAIASQFVFLIHAIPAAAMAFLLPKLSNTSNAIPILRIYFIGGIVTVAVAGCVTFFMKYLFEIWYGQPDSIVQEVFGGLLTPIIIYSLAIVPYYYVAATESVLALSLGMFGVSSLFVICLYILSYTDFGVQEFLLFKSSFVLLSAVIIYVIYFAKVHKKKVNTVPS